MHENLEANHLHGQAKFLEQPARAMKNELGASVRADAHNGIGLATATEKAAVKLLEASRELVPVATGVLKASGFVRDAKGNLIAGSEMTADEARAWRTLLEKQERERARQTKQESEAR